MHPEPGTPQAKANPFRFVAHTPAGPFDVTAEKGRLARVRCMPRPGGGLVPVALGPAHLLVVAEMAHAGAGWTVRSLVSGPANGSPGLPDAEARRLLREALAPSLDASMRRFVERDIVEVYAQRRAREDAIAAIQAEIQRRRDKIRLMRRDASRAERLLGPAEEALRAELARLDGTEPRRDGTRGPVPGPLAMAL